MVQAGISLSISPVAFPFLAFFIGGAESEGEGALHFSDDSPTL